MCGVATVRDIPARKTRVAKILSWFVTDQIQIPPGITIGQTFAELVLIETTSECIFYVHEV